MKEKFIFRYGTHYIKSAQFGGQILFENSRTSSVDSDINDLAESAWKEIQTAFGSSTGTGGGVDVPVQLISVNLGGKLKHTETNNLANNNRKQSYGKTSNA